MKKEMYAWITICIVIDSLLWEGLYYLLNRVFVEIPVNSLIANSIPLLVATGFTLFMISTQYEMSKSIWNIYEDKR